MTNSHALAPSAHPSPVSRKGPGSLRRGDRLAPWSSNPALGVKDHVKADLSSKYTLWEGAGSSMYTRGSHAHLARP